MNQKPLGKRAYGSIPHLPGSRLGVGDHHCHEGQSIIATQKARDRHDLIIVQEKLDGSNCAVAKIDDKIIALGRAGYVAISSKYSVHHSFQMYVNENEERFYKLLHEGERVVGEYLAQAVGTIYKLSHEPFVPFDIMKGNYRNPFDLFNARVLISGFTPPNVISIGQPFPISEMLECIEVSGHGAIDKVEGAIWRVQRKGEVDFIVKYVRQDKEDGKYFPERNNGVTTWNDERYKVEMPETV